MNGHPQYVLKRDGRVVPFDAKKIATALAKAGAVTGEFDEAKAERLALLVLEQLPHDITPAIETIQDVVEETLLGLHHIKTARAYIAYRSQHARLRNDIRTVVDVESSINEYLDQSDWRVNANANQGWSLGGMILNTSGKVIAAFNETSSKGVDLAGKPGDPVLAAAGGRVVYAGTGLRGYGKLVIVKHDNSFLSAYAHNQSLLVKEGQAVSKGQKIAELGDTDSDRPKLHFEIRRQGKPVDPGKYLPPR